MYTFCLAIPAYNEAEVISSTLQATIAFCKQHFNDASYVIVVADNNSSDATASLVKEIASRTSELRYLFVKEQGKGAAIEAAWNSFEAQNYVFMDADLATDLSALPVLLERLSSGADVVFGSRYHKQSVVQRSIIRKIISRGYRLLLRLLLNSKVTDAPCGFKGITHAVKKTLLSEVTNTTWFFDSELLLRAEASGLAIEPIPVIWKEPRINSVQRLPFVAVVLEYISKVLELRKELRR